MMAKPGLSAYVSNSGLCAMHYCSSWDNAIVQYFTEIFIYLFICFRQLLIALFSWWGIEFGMIPLVY